MEAATLQKKKSTISKGKMKKSIKNVLCRPDPVFWPVLSEDHNKLLEAALSKYKVQIPQFKKPHWKELKAIPKDKRPKAPKINKVDGLLFGISECCNAVQNGQCTAVIIESAVNPRIIVQPLLEACIAARVPVVCLNELRKISLNYFGIGTSCLGIKGDFLLDLKSQILQLGETKKEEEPEPEKIVEKMEIETLRTEETINNTTPNPFVYLYRTNKKSRVFVPSAGDLTKGTKNFVEQDFIEFTNKEVKDKTKNQAFRNIILKKISNNPNRVKRK